MKAEIKLWARPLANGKKKLYVDCIFGNANIKENRKHVHTKLSIDPKYWDNKKKDLKRSYPHYEVLSKSIRELRNKIENQTDRLLSNQISKEQFINIIANKSSIESIDDYIETEIKTTLKGKTYKTYKDNFKTFKNYVGFSGKKMKFSDITPSLLNKFKREFFKGEIGKANKSGNSFNTHCTQLRAIVNNAEDNGYIYNKLVFKKGYMVKKTRSKWKQSTPEDFLDAVSRVQTLRQWEAMTMWLLAFNCRGMYWADFTSMSISNVEDNDLYNTWCGTDALYLDHYRHKTQDTEGIEMKIRIDQYPTLQLFILAKLSFAKRYFKLRPEIVPPAQNWLEIFKYDLNKNERLHEQIINSYQKALREVGFSQLKYARKNFNNIAGECMISPRICDLLIGHSPDSRLNNMSYTDYTTSDYARQIDEAHTKVLDRFRVSELGDALQDKLEELSLVKSKKIYSWITNHIPKKDRYGNRTEGMLDLGEEEAKRTGYWDYIKDSVENSFIDNLKSSDEELIYNR